MSMIVNPEDLIIVTASLPDGNVGDPYSHTLAASGGTPPYTWSISAGSLPGGLSLDPSSGSITGTPITAGTSNFTAMATDSLSVSVTKPMSITIIPEDLTIVTDSLPNGVVGFPYSQSLMAFGGTPPYTWSISAGSLPDGLPLISTPSTGNIVGTPTTAGTSNFTVMVTDNLGVSVTKPMSILVNPELTIITASLPDGMTYTPYSQTLVASGGTPPYTWSIDAGSLPDGLELDPSSGSITGMPFWETGSWTPPFTVKVSDGYGTSHYVTKTMSITIIPNDLAIVTASLPDGMEYAPYSQALVASGGTPPYTWSISAGSLPTGLLLDPSSGNITGFPYDGTGISSFTVELTDSPGLLTLTKSMSIMIIPNDLTIVTDSLPWGMVGVPYSQTLVASGGTPPYTWSISGYLPQGLSLDPSSGNITGTPTDAINKSFTVVLSDSSGLLTITKPMFIGIAANASNVTIQATLQSPGELVVYDSQNHATGLLNGTVREEIPNSSYNSATHTVVINPANDSYYYQVAGTGSGTYGLEIIHSVGGLTVTFNGIDIPTFSGAIHRYIIDWDALAQGELGVTVQADHDIDGVFERSFASDGILTQGEFMLQTDTVVNFQPDTLNLISKGEAVTVYIELPIGYDVNDIDVSTIRLNGVVPALTKPTNVGDYDNDGVSDLMVKFNRSDVQSILSVGDKVTIAVIGKVNSSVFEGVDHIRVIRE
jgi:hypothetical protein